MEAVGYIFTAFLQADAIFLASTTISMGLIDQFIFKLGHSDLIVIVMLRTNLFSIFSIFLVVLFSQGLPNHELNLKVGVPIMLLRNIDQPLGLCNGMRLIITQMGNFVLEAKIISGNSIGQKVYIPRLTLSPSPSDTKLPFMFQRKQFPIMVSFAITINKSQGQSLKNVGIYLPKLIFSHGQLYVALSRVTSRDDGLKMLICDDEGHVSNKTNNVIYKEVFQNLR
uniref:Helicase, putative n=1 Tax=Medicago truncatula TaxID=3880 RepID=A7UQU1_MEDTR|nr:Helicase, putative [Medicago truncatula]